MRSGTACAKRRAIVRKDSRRTSHPGIYKIGDRRYRVRAKYIDERTGRPHEIDREVEAANPAEAQRLRGELLRAERDRNTGVSDERVRLRDYAERWLTAKTPELRPSTARLYKDVVNQHVIPTLGDFFLDALTYQEIVGWRDRQTGAPETINGRLKILRRLVKAARTHHAMARDPMEGVNTVRRRDTGDEDDEALRRSLTGAELRIVLTKAREIEPEWHPLLSTLALTGMRFGEVSALKWNDLDEAAGVIRVRPAHWHGHVGGTKTGKTRRIPLLPALAEILKAHRRRLLEEQAPGFSEGWFFPSDVGTLRQPSSVRKPLARILAAAGIRRRFSPHGFRHTFNNLARQLAGGEVVRSTTGHMTSEMTDHYSHVEGGEKLRVVEGIARSAGVGGDGGGD